MQRIGDHDRIQHFLTGSSLNTLFSVFNMVVFSGILLYYNTMLFSVVLGANLLYGVWVWLFMERRKELDYKRFALSANNQGQLIELLGGVQEIKLAGAERQKRWEWERTQAKLFRTSMQGLALEQYQQAGGTFLQSGKDIIISFISAKAVIDGHLSLGMMLAVQSIIGQLNAPLLQLIGFLRSAQDAKISLERLAEIHDRDNETASSMTDENQVYAPITIAETEAEEKSLFLQNVSFRYGSPNTPFVINDLSLHIPQGKITAIVGSSGSGKTTLLKLLLQFYQLNAGDIKLGTHQFEQLAPREWRKRCGVVMQDGYIFSDTIARNIALGCENEQINYAKLRQAAKTACIWEHIEGLPLGLQTKIGKDGMGLSGGQKQRLLIARAVYKDPEYLFFDEATSSLDANNEQRIMQNLDDFFWGRTVVVVAYRLSTVRNADQIIVLEHGAIAEQGNHADLVAKQGRYFELVRNQLELGS